MAEVYGNIGNERVELNNAATEATLKLLLQATLSANKQTVDQIKGMAKQSGLQVDEANEGLNVVGQGAVKSAGLFKTLHVTTGLATEQLRQWGSQFTPFIGQLVNGTAQSSDAFGLLRDTIGKLHPALGMMLSGVVAIAKLQEENLAAYRKISASGVNFAGDLMLMRNTAAQAGLTLGEMTDFVKANGENLARMGGTADQGAQQVLKMAKELRNSELGSQLRSLGYTSQDAANGMASYIAMTGGRSKEEMKNTAGIKQGTAEYLEQLDRLAQITGKTRQEAEAAAKKASQNSAYQAALAGMDEKAKKASAAGLTEFANRFGDAGAELYQAALMGIPPQTEAAKQLAALSPEVYEAAQQMARAGKSGADLATVQRIGNQATVAGVEASRRLGDEFKAAASFQSGPMAQAVQSLQRAQIQAEQTQTDTAEGAKKRDDEIAENNKKRAAGTAAAMAETENSMKNASASVLSIFTPAINAVTPYLQMLTSWLDKAVTSFAELSPKTQALIGILGGTGAVGIALVTTAMVAKRLLGIGGRGSAPGNPMYVSGGGILGGGPDLPDKGGGKGGKFSKIGKFAKIGAGGLGGILGGVALDAAEEKLKESGNVKGAAAAGIGSSSLKGAGTGAMLGSIVPGVGTAIGGAVGGVLGAGYGLWQNRGTLFGGSTKPETKAEKQKEAVVQEQSNTQDTVEESLLIQSDMAENLTKELKQLNTTAVELLRAMRETADFTKRNNDAIKGLGGNLFPTP
jgi:cyclophilin family peptidyl-prolyl cis-trans isomerase